MQVRIRYKLFLIIAITSIISILMMAIALQWNTQQSFITFQTQLELDFEASNLTQLVGALSSYYKKHHRWRNIDGSATDIIALLKLHAAQNEFRQTSAEKEISPISSTNLTTSVNGETLNYDSPSYDNGYNNNPGILFKRLSLLDDNEMKVAGQGKLQDKKLPIHLNGKIIGWLAIEKPASSQFIPSRLLFKKDQHKKLLITIVIISIFALIISILFSRQFENRITKLTNLSHALTQGKFERIEEIESNNDEFGKLAKDLNSLSKTLEKNETMRRRWIADTSHELRTPIAILRGEIEALIDRIHKPTEEVFSSLQEEIEHLTKLVDDVHMLSLSEAGALKYYMDDVDIGRVIMETIDTFKTRSSNKDITISHTIYQEYIIVGDKTRLQQLFKNLFENSIRYTRSPGEICISIIKKYNFAVITIEDTPPTPTKHEIANLFNRFYRAETSRNRRTGGSGLGLAICHNIIDTHKGLIEAYQATTGGLGIQISLPLRKQDNYG